MKSCSSKTVSEKCNSRDKRLHRRNKAKQNQSVSSASESSSFFEEFKKSESSLEKAEQSLGEKQTKKSTKKKVGKRRNQSISLVSIADILEQEGTSATESQQTKDGSMGIPEIVITDEVGPPSNKRRKSLNQSIVVLGEVRADEQVGPPIKRKRMSHSIPEADSSSNVINLCDDDVSIIEIECTPKSKVTPAEDIILLDPSPAVVKEPSIPVRGKKRDRTCTVTNSSAPRYDSLLGAFRVGSEGSTDVPPLSSLFTVDKNGWALLKQQRRNESRRNRVRGSHSKRPERAARARSNKKPPPTVSTADGMNPYGSNIFNPNPQVSQKSGALRPIVIDGSNVAIGHSKGARLFSCRGLQICVDYFAKRGHQVKAFVPQYRKSCNYATDKHIFSILEKAGQIVFTPSRRLPGRLLVSYDDRYIVQYAAEVGGVIVSTDNYRDLVRENEAWRDTIENRLLMFTWVDDVLMFPSDPLGRNGPNLEEFLRFSP